MNAFIKSVGVYVPKNILTNVDLEKRVDTTDAWISSRTDTNVKLLKMRPLRLLISLQLCS
jgi:3-oxoacyl-[acyl-carrier-protein] synthase-3